MAQVFGTSLEFLSTLSDDAQRLLDGARAITSATLNGKTFLYVAAQFEPGFEVLEITEDGNLTSVARVLDNASLPLASIYDLQTVVSLNETYLVTVGLVDDGIGLFELSDTGPYVTFRNSATTTTEPTSNLLGALDVSIYQKTLNDIFLYVTGIQSDGLSVFELSPTGGLNLIQNIDNNVPNNLLDGAWGNTLVRLSGTMYLGVTSLLDNALTIFSESTTTTGAMSYETVFQLDGSLGQPKWLSAKEIDGTAFFYVGQGNGVSIIRYDGANITQIGRIESDSRLAEVGVPDIFDVGDRTFLSVPAEFSDNFTLFEIESDPFSATKGGLTPIESIRDNTGNGALDGVVATETVWVGSKLFLIALGRNDDAVNLYEVGGSDDVLNGTQDGDSINGAGGDDIIYGFDGDDFIIPGAGSDIVFAGGGDDSVRLSTGEDRLFGGSGRDTISASSLETTTGLTIDFLRNEVLLPGGDIQFIADFEIAFGTAFGDVLIGDDVDNEFYGFEGNDLIRGRGGRDEIYAGAGEDQVFGADGNDFLELGAGNDLANGGSGVDWIDGGDGNDRIFGGADLDQLEGRNGNDLIKGNDGDDEIGGGFGNDILFGQAGDDIISGGPGDDVISGGSGRDFIKAGADDDTLTGGSAADIFQFDTVQDEGGGTNTITDFKTGVDKISLTEYFLTFAEVLNRSTQNGTSVDITMFDTQVIRVMNMTVAQLVEDDFIL